MRQWDLIERNRLAKALAWSERDIAGIQKRGSISGKFGGLDVKIGIVEYVSGCRVRHVAMFLSFYPKTRTSWSTTKSTSHLSV